MLYTIKKIIKKFFKLKTPPESVFLSYHYQRHNQRRLEHLASIGLNIANSTVLEVGAGIGDHTSFFIDRGCQVVTSDARQENVKILNSRYPNVKVLCLDLDNPPGTFNKVFDIIYSYGLLYHLKNPSEAIEFMSSCCRKLLLLETCVSFGNENLLNLCAEDILNPTQSYVGSGCRPTRRWVYSQLKRHFEFVYLPVTQPNHEEFPIDWTRPPSKQILTRAVFVASREQINNKFLVEEIPMKQIRH
ncbi:MAG: class I SAM-dependent methyltransferase [Candidatus Hodarchaeota archaeon]